MLAGAAVAWMVKKQQSIALSTYDAEIVSGSLAGCDGVFIRGLSSELGHPQNKPTVLNMDSSSAIDLANEPVMHNASKHIMRRDLFLRELVHRGDIIPVLVKTSDNVADALTKPLAKGPFVKHRNVLLGHGQV